jgi:hypothetical protein
MSFNALKSFARARMKYYKAKRYDRASFLRYFLSQVEGERWKDPPPYSTRLEMEIKRVARLEQPWRTFRACALIEAFQDAKTATECIRRGRELSEELQKSERSLENLERKLLGLPQTPVDKA